MTGIPFEIIASIVGTFASGVGLLLLRAIRESIKQNHEINVQLSVMKTQLIQALDLKAKVDADHDRLVAVDTRLRSHVEKDRDEKLAWFDKLRDVNSKISELRG